MKNLISAVLFAAAILTGSGLAAGSLAASSIAASSSLASDQNTKAPEAQQVLKSGYDDDYGYGPGYTFVTVYEGNKKTTYVYDSDGNLVHVIVEED